jgi:membrane fusion protein (multidrug efflux system)
MKRASGLTITTLMVCLFAPNTPLLADEAEFVTDVAVHTGKITRTTLHRYVMAYGMVEPQPAINGKLPASSKIAAPIMGILNQVHCEEGQHVQKGAPLFELDTRTADALTNKAKVAVEFAQKNFARKQQLIATDNISRKLYDEAEQLLQTARKDLANAQTQRELLLIRTPLSGTVAAIHFKVGEAVSLNAVLADLIDLSRLDIAIRVPSQEALSLQLGQQVNFYAGTEVQRGQDSITPQEGKLAFISPQIDPLTDTILVRASLNSDSRMRPGQFVSVRIVVEERAQRLVVPIESVITNETASLIALVEGDRAKQKMIKLGLRDGNFIEVEGEGLQEGMTIVTEGAYGLPPETHIRVVK